MCQIMEELNAKAAAKAAAIERKRTSLQIASKMLNEGDSVEKIVKCCKLTVDEVRELAENRNKLS